MFLRALALNSHDFWFDEAFTYHISKLPANLLLKAVITDNNPPLYYLLIHLVLNISNSEIAIRLPSQIANIATIPLIFQLAKRLQIRNIGPLASSLFLVSPLAIYLAGESRLHAIAMFLALAQTVSFTTLLRNPKKIPQLTFILLSTVAIYTQYYLALLFLPFTILIVREKTLNLKRWFVISSCVFFAVLPWLILSARTIHNGCACPNTALSLPATLVSVAIAGVGNVSMRTFPTLPWPIFLLLVLTSIYTVLLFIKGLVKNRTLSDLYLIPLLTLSIAGLFLPVFSPKAFAVFSPFYLMIVALGIMSTRYKKALILALILLFSTISLMQIIIPFFSGEKLKKIDAIARANQKVPVLHASTTTYYSTNFYAKGDYANFLITKNPLSYQTVEFIGGKKKELANFAEFLFVDTPKWVDQKDYQNTKREIFYRYNTIRSYKINDITVYYMEAR